MKFFYRAKTQTGETQQGAIETSSKESAISLLQSHGLIIIEVIQEPQISFWIGITRFLQKVSGKEFYVFLRQLSTLFEARISIDSSLKTLFNQTKNPALKEVLFEMNSDIEAGISLSSAMAKRPHIFSNFYVQMVKSAEVTGRLEETFKYLADYAENQYELGAKARSALVYPIFVIVVFVGVLTLILTQVLPQLVSIFAGFEVRLPAGLRFLIALSGFIKMFGPFLLIGIVFLILFLIYYLRTPEGKLFFDIWIVRIPVIGAIYKNIYRTRFAQTTSSLTSGGIPIADALEISADAIDNYIFQQILYEIATSVRRGEQISVALGRFPEHFPPMMTEMVAIGERTGQIEELLTRVAKYYDQEVSRSLQAFIDLLQPAIIILLGVVVAFLVASIILPIYQLTSSI